MIPDKIPEFPNKRDFLFQVPIEMSEEVRALERRHNLSTEQIGHKFLSLGFILAESEERGGRIVIERDLVLFGDEKSISEPEGGLHFILTIGSGKYSVTADSEWVGRLQELANKKHRTVEDICREFFRKGLEVARAEDDPNSTVLLIVEDTEREIKLF